MDKTMEDALYEYYCIYWKERFATEPPEKETLLATKAIKYELAAMKEWETITNKSRDEVNRGLQNACKKWEEICGEQKQEIERLKGLIKKQWEINFYLTCPTSVHAGVMNEFFKNQLQKFKTENQL